MSQLVKAEEQVTTIKGKLIRIDELCEEACNLIENYDYIKQISQTHQNFVATRKIYEKFSDLDAELERVKELLTYDEKGGAENGNYDINSTR